MSSFTNNLGSAVSARTTANRDLITLPYYMKWLAQGKIFEAGHSLQTDGDDSQGEASVTPDDVKATWALQAPPDGNTLVIPLQFKAMWEAEGGAATDYQLIFTRAADAMGVTLGLSGRAMAAKNCLYAANPIKNTAKASPLYGVATTFLLTVSALDTADDCVMYDFTAMSDNNVAASKGTIAVQQREYNWLETAVPHIMSSGAAMIFYCSSGTSDAVLHPYIMWAEVTIDDLL